MKTKFSSTKWIFIITVTVCFITASGLYFLSEKSRQWSYASEQKTLCEKNGARACTNLALDYHHGVTGRCTDRGTYRGAPYTYSCRLLEKDEKSALYYANIACEQGSYEGCFYQWQWLKTTIDSLDDREKLLSFCKQAVNISCQVLANIAVQHDNSELLIQALKPACDNDEILACLHLIRLDVSEMTDQSLVKQLRFLQTFALSERGISHLLNLCRSSYHSIYEAKHACDTANKFQESFANYLKNMQENKLKPIKERMASMTSPLTELHVFLNTLPQYRATPRKR